MSSNWEMFMLLANGTRAAPAPKREGEVLLPGTKRCNECEEVKSFEDFYTQRRKRTWEKFPMAKCKVCRDIRQKEMKKSV